MSDPIFTAPIINPFGLTDVGSYASPTLVDIDGDGDLDAFIGNLNGNTLFFRNTGTAATPGFAAPIVNPFGLTEIGSFASPTFVDIDDDGDLDTLFGDGSSNTLFSRNTGTADTPVFATPSTNPFGLNGGGTKTFADIDDDGDLDAFAVNYYGDANTLFFRNTGTAATPGFAAPIVNPFGLTNSYYAPPTLADIDGDGDLDAFVGNDYDGVAVFSRNTGTAATPGFAAPIANSFGLTVADYTSLTFADIDGDGDLDAFVGAYDGNTLFFRNDTIPVNNAPTFIISDGDGTVVTDFGGRDYITMVTIQADGKILAAGTSDPNFALARYNANGSLDTSFDDDGKVTTDFGSADYGNGVAIQVDGKILVAGTNGSDLALARYNANGSLDTSFDGDGKVTTDFGGSDASNSIAIQADGKILVAGTNGSDFVLARYNANGSLDTSFDDDGKITTDFGGSDASNSIAIQADGKILVVGSRYSGGWFDFALARYNANGSLDTSFGTDGKVTTDFGLHDYGRGITVQADGKILVAGTTGGGGSPSWDFSFARYNANGSLDTGFGSNGLVTTRFSNADGSNSVTLQPDGKILVGGGTDGSNYTGNFALARYNTDGTLDTTFDSSSRLNNIPTYTENGAPVVLDPQASIFDQELAALNNGTGNYNGAKVTLSRHGGANSQDVFSASGALTFTNGKAVLAGTIIGTVSNSSGTLTITFNANATQAVVDHTLSSIAYANTSDTPPSSVLIDWIFADGNTGSQGTGGALTGTGSTTVMITAVRDDLILTGTAGNDTLIGDAIDVGSYDTLNGLAGNDILDGRLGVDTMIGGDGNDTYFVDNAGDVVTETSASTGGVDVVNSSLSTYTLSANVENGSILATGTASLIGNSLDNVLSAGAGNNILNGGAGSDTVVYTSASSGVTLNLTVTTAQATGGSGSDTLIGIENLTGSLYNDTLTGNSSDNILDGGSGSDTMAGGAGNDTYVVNTTGDVVTELVGAGIDIIQSSVTYSLVDTDGAGANGGNVENLTLTGTAAVNATGNGFNNLLTGNSGANVLDGGVGNDTMAGGGGDDTYVINGLADIVTELAGGGMDTIQSGISYSLADTDGTGANGGNVENLTLTGTAALNATGNGLDNLLTGNSGANILAGGLGNDTYVVNSNADIVQEQADAGIDTVQSSITYSLVDTDGGGVNGGNVENLTLIGSADCNAIGNTLDNVLTGNSGANVLLGGAGSDTVSYANATAGVNISLVTNTATGFGADTLVSIEHLIGSDYNDTLTGTTGANVLAGGRGDDTYVINDNSTIVQELINAGTDTIQSSITYSLVDTDGTGVNGGNVEALILTGTAAVNATGNGLNNALTGNSGANLLDGGAGGDAMAGGSGNDIYVIDNIGDMVTELAGGGIDTIRSSITYSLVDTDGTGVNGGNVENLILTGTAALNATGNNLNNRLTGNSNANVLIGGAGNDAMVGGSGNDTYVVDSNADMVTELVGGGSDTIRSSITYSLVDTDGAGANGGNVENLLLTGTAALNATGNDLDNGLTGNSGANLLDGGLGADTMAGGSGNDIYLVDHTGDIVTELVGAGNDTIQTQMSYSLADTDGAGANGGNIENLTLTGIATVNGTGNDLANALTGNSGANVLDGRVGADTMAGGAGNDTYVVDNSGDIVTELVGGGIDTIHSSITYNLADTDGTGPNGGNVEHLTLTGAAAVNATGNDLDNRLMGNGSANVLDGGAGSDTMAGGAGNDTYVVNTSSDVVIELVGAGIDTIQSSSSYSLVDTDGAGVNGGNVENLTLIGSADCNAIGNGLDNVLTGTSGANTFSGGAGNDTVSYGNATGGVNASLLTNTATGFGADTLVSIEHLTGSNSNDTLTGNGANNILNGGAGSDTMAGGTGDDTYVVNTSSDVVTELVGAGSDTIQSSISYSLADTDGTGTNGGNVENLLLIGTAAINATGNGLDNVLTGNSGANVLDGGAGNNTLIGGLGNDTYVVNTSSDMVTELVGGGTDTILSSISYSLVDTDGTDLNGGNVENLTLTGTADINAIGNTLGNVLTGNSGANMLDGGVGIDTMAGGLGDDLYVINSSADIVTELVGAGIDTIQSSISYSLADTDGTGTNGGNVENLMLTGTAALNATGNGLDNVLIGNSSANIFNGGSGLDTVSYVNATGAVNASLMTNNATGFGADTFVSIENLTGSNANDMLTGNTGANVLDGGAGSDTMAGGAGNDTYVVDSGSDIITELVGAGIDTIQSTISANLTDTDGVGANGGNVENLTLLGTAALNATGNGLNNVLTGNSGANVLDGGAGSDTMVGGLGNDTYIVDSSSDVVTELTGEGTDTIQSGITYSLVDTDGTGANGGNVENLVLTGTAALNATGNGLNNVLTGNSGANTIDGGAGSDTMAGGLGSDIYTIDNSSDVVTELVGSGIDTIRSSISYSLADTDGTGANGGNVENLILIGSATNATGNDLDNVLTGTSGANSFNGGSGIDTVSYANATGSVNANLVTNTATGFGADTFIAIENLTGSNSNDTLAGNNGDNILDGGAGIDTLAGGSGNDIYIIDYSGDAVTELAGEGSDTILSSISYSLMDTDGTGTNGGNVEHLALTGTADINATGNNLDNILTGNSGSNLFTGGLGMDTVSYANATGVVDASLDTALATGFGADILIGIENLAGSAFNDTLAGDAGTNVLNGGLGNDMLTGGSGMDIFVFDSRLDASSNIDILADFNVTDDTLKLDKTIFTQLSVGTLTASQLRSSATGMAEDSNDYILYNTTTGALLYDSDGNGVGAATQFATLTAKPSITAADFVVIA